MTAYERYKVALNAYCYRYLQRMGENPAEHEVELPASEYPGLIGFGMPIVSISLDLEIYKVYAMIDGEKTAIFSGALSEDILTKIAEYLEDQILHDSRLW